MATFCRLLGVWGFLCVASSAWGDPRPGDVFREYHFVPKGSHISEVDPATKRENIRSWVAAARADRPLEIGDLDQAIKAEVAISYWGGHIGTGGQNFRVNGGPWIAVPQPLAPEPPQAYYRTLMGRPAAAIPLEQLVRGQNTFQFAAGPQIKYSFDWGFYWIYGFAARVYYDQAKPHATGRVIAPPDGQIGENPVFNVEVDARGHQIERVELIGCYDDFNYEGDGRWRQWHYQVLRGQWLRHIGTAAAPPYRIAWDTRWIPDQEKPVEIAARLVDSSGLSVITPAVSLNFARNGRSVRLVRPVGVPEKFGVRTGAKMSCRFPIENLNRPSPPAEARLVLSTWSAAHADAIGFNGTKIVDRVGKVHDVSYDAIGVPVELLREGENEFFIYSATREHAAEVNWPGPALVIAYDMPAKRAPGKAQ